MRNGPTTILAAALLALASACGSQPAAEGTAIRADRPELGLMGTIPIYWGEAESFGGLVSGEGTRHWARDQLEADYRLRPLDVLDSPNLGGFEFLLLAQPRPLSPGENVALDAWVRGGGRLLLLVDPLLTGESVFALGDRRRPQDTILLSPILAHWGLELQFDANQPVGVTLLEHEGATIPVNLPGRFARVGSEQNCELAAAAVLARCELGAGHIVLLADGAVLDLHDPAPAAPAALDWLVRRAFERGN